MSNRRQKDRCRHLRHVYLRLWVLGQSFLVLSEWLVKLLLQLKDCLWVLLEDIGVLRFVILGRFLWLGISLLRITHLMLKTLFRFNKWLAILRGLWLLYKAVLRMIKEVLWTIIVLLHAFSRARLRLHHAVLWVQITGSLGIHHLVHVMAILWLVS